MSVALAQEEILPVDLVRETSAETNLAIYVINRNAGEGADRTPTKGDYYLADAELGNIALLRLAFEKVVVVLNVVSIDASWYEASGANALVLMSNLGQLGGDALVSLLKRDSHAIGKTDRHVGIFARRLPLDQIFRRNQPGRSLRKSYRALYGRYLYWLPLL